MGRESLSSLEAALALSASTGVRFAWNDYRRRSKGPPGFCEPESRAIRLMAEICGARVSGGAAGETRISFEPGPPRAGSYRVELEGAEPLLSLVRAAAVPLALAEGESELIAVGATHGPEGDTFEVSSSTWLYWMKRIGVALELHLDRVGFAPRGQGELRLAVSGLERPASGIDLRARGKLETLQIVSTGAAVPTHVLQRQAARARSGVSIAEVPPTVQLLELSGRSAGSAVAVTGIFGGAPVTVAEIASRGISAESVGERAAVEFRRALASRAMLPSCLVEAFLIASSVPSQRSCLTATRLPSNVHHLSELVRRFTGREVRVEGKPREPGAVLVSAPGCTGPARDLILDVTQPRSN
ncbi:MAG: RNA 3'-terminal phosphate cyclase [Vicinamibacteria bacterium]